jgi:hypothetical protein
MSEYKFYCPQCGQHILCDTGHSGMQINCPICQQKITVPQATATIPITPQPVPVYPPPSGASPAGGRPYPINPVAQPAVLANSRALKNRLTVVAAVLVLAGLGVGSWFGYSEIKIYSQRGHYPPGLIAMWSGNDNAADSVGGHNGEPVSGVELVPGIVGKAFKFNGVDKCVSIPDVPSFRPTSLTVAGWIKFTPVQGRTYVIAAKAYGPDTSDSYAVWYDGSVLHGYITTPSGEGAWVSYAWTPEADTWHHIAYTFDNIVNTESLFVDGVSVASSAVSGPIGYDAHPFLIGADNDRGNLWGWFEGLIDGLGIFNRALSASEIQAIYTSQK